MDRMYLRCFVTLLILLVRGSTGAQSPVTKLAEIPDIGPCESVRFSPAGSFIYSYDGTQERNPPEYSLRVWDAKDLKPLYSFSTTEGYPTFSRDDNVVLTTNGVSKAF